MPHVSESSTKSRKILHATVVDYLKKKHKLNYSQIGESIGVHRSHIQKVSKCKSPLSEKKFDLLCKVWNVDTTEITKRMELDNLEVLRWKTLKKMIKAKEVNLVELSMQTGISVLELNLILQDKKELTDEYVQKISEFLDIDSQIISEGQIALVMELVKKSLSYIHIEPTAVEAVISFIEMQI